MDVRYFKSAAEFRKWLEKYHAKRTELWVGFYKKSTSLKGISYLDAVDQAVCFGWIDGIKKKVDELSYTHRFTPRKSRSNWSSTNIKRAVNLSKLGLMHISGIEVFNLRDKEKMEQYFNERKQVSLDRSFEKLFKTNEKAWAFFQSQPPSYKKVAIFWLMTAKKEETRLRRLLTLIEDSANNRRLAVVTFEPKKNHQ